MSPSIEVRRTIGAHEVVPGARIPVASNYEAITFRFVAVCDAVDPDRWHGEVVYAGKALITTSSTDNYEKAGRGAEQALRARVVEIFGSASPGSSSSS